MTERITTRPEIETPPEVIPEAVAKDKKERARLWNEEHKGKSKRRRGRVERLRDLPNNTLEGTKPRQGMDRKHLKRG